MAALKDLFRTRSIASTHESRRRSRPDRVDFIAVDWTRRHRYLTAVTVLDGEFYEHWRSGITKVSRSSIARSVYQMTTLAALRKLVESLESELQVAHQSFKTQGLMFDPEMPAQLVQFLSQDEGLQKKSLESVPGVSHSEVWKVAGGVMGLLVL